MPHILKEVSGTGSYLGLQKSRDIVKYTGPSTKKVMNGQFFVVVGFIDNSQGDNVPIGSVALPNDDSVELGSVDNLKLYRDGIDARDEVADNLMVTLSVAKRYWHQKYWSEYVFVS